MIFLVSNAFIPTMSCSRNPHAQILSLMLKHDTLFLVSSCQHIHHDTLMPKYSPLCSNVKILLLVRSCQHVLHNVLTQVLLSVPSCILLVLGAIVLNSCSRCLHAKILILSREPLFCLRCLYSSCHCCTICSVCSPAFRLW